MSSNYAKYSGLGGGSGGGSGTVTSVALAAPASILSVSGSPVTSSGTLTLALATQSANTVWAGPTTGAAANPTFRALVAADLPFALTNLTDAGTDGITITNGTGAVVGASPVTIAQHVADATHNGYLLSTDWSTFNGKQPAGTYIKADGSVDFAANQSMASHKLTNLTDPSGAQDAATKAYVDAAVSALQPATSVFAATTTNLTGTYLNGVAGVGATFTITTTGAFTLDGTTPAVNARILIKDQSSGFQNGVYNLTVAGTTGVSPVLTRSLDYNTASDMNQAGLIPVTSGTVNALSSWQQTATITTVGTDALVFQEFTANPSLYLLKANNLSDVASKSTSFNNLSPMTTSGDIIYGGASGTGTRLAKGSDTQVLTLVSGLPAWAAPATAGTVTSVAMTVPAFLSISGSPVTSAGTLALSLSGTALPIANGGTAVTSVTTAPAATTFAGWDANKNLSANSLLEGYTTTATAAGTTTLTVGSTFSQYFTGATTQTLVLPVATTLINGQQFQITNLSSGLVTVQTSGSNTIQAMAANTTLVVTCVNTAGGTGTASWSWVYSPTASGLPLTNPMTTGGDVIYGGASGVPTRLANGSNGQYLKSTGGTSAPAWQSFTAPTLQKFTSTGTTVGWLFTISTTTTCAVNDTYTNNSNTYTVLAALTAQSGQVLFMSGASAPKASGTLTRASGAGTASVTFTSAVATATYTTPANTLYLKIRVVGGGGGGAGSGTQSAGTPTGGTGGTGGSTCFGPNLLFAVGGVGSVGEGNTGGVGGTASLGTGPIGVALQGGTGNVGSTFASSSNIIPSGGGASSPFGGAGGGSGNGTGAGIAAIANSGSGGGGAGWQNASSGCAGGGGGAGGYVDVIITSPAATYVYCIGAAGSAGSAGTSGSAGGAGGSGLIIVEEHYQ